MKPAQAKAVIANIKAGSFLDTAAADAGISGRTVRRWRARGRDALDLADDNLRAVPKADRPFARFAVDCDRELAIVEAGLVRKVAESEDWRSAAFLLERRFPERYAPTTKVSVTAGVRNDAATALLQLLEAKLRPDTFQEVLSALSGEEPATVLRRPTVLMLAPGPD